MTVPGAVELIRELAPTLPAAIPARRRNRDRRRRRRARSSTPARGSSSARCSGRRSSPPATSATWRRCPAASRRPRSSTRTSAAPTSSRCFRRRRSGPQFIKDVRAPLPQVKLMPTGGVTLDNAGDWIRAGAVAVGVGSALLDAKAIEERPLRRDYATTRGASSRTSPPREIASPPWRTRVVTFGEIMLRLSPPGFERFFQSPVLSATFGGGEANVAVSLAQFGLDSHYVTRLPAHAIGDAARAGAARRRGRHRCTSLRGGSRVGIYFTETRRQPARVDGRLRPRALRDQRDATRRGATGTR